MKIEGLKNVCPGCPAIAALEDDPVRRSYKAKQLALRAVAVHEAQRAAARINEIAGQIHCNEQEAVVCPAYEIMQQEQLETQVNNG